MPTLELPGLYADNVAAIVAVDRPLLVNRDPGPGETGVPLEWPIALEVINPGPDGIDRPATRVWVDGALAFDGDLVPEIQPGFDGPRAQVVETADTLRIVLDPAVPFVSQATVAVRVVSQTIGGAHSLDQTYSFDAEDRTAPRVLAAQATAQRVVEIGFDEDVVVTDPTGFVLEALGFPAVPVAPVSATADGRVTQHGDLANDRLAHAGGHNGPSVGIEVTTPYYESYLRAGLPWSRVIDAPWAHRDRYVVPTPEQAEAMARLIGWLTSPDAKGLSIPRTWTGLDGTRLAMGRIADGDQRRPGVWAHHLFHHADGSWPVLYAWLRLEAGLAPCAAYEEAVRLATGARRHVDLGELAAPPVA